MTRKEIDASWGQSKTGRAVHKKFPQEMAKRTVINRAAKAFINTSDDSDLLVEAINNSTENEYDNERKDITPEQQAQRHIEQNANKETLDFEQPNQDEPIEAQYTEVQEETSANNGGGQQESLFTTNEGPAF